MCVPRISLSLKIQIYIYSLAITTVMCMETSKEQRGS